MGIFSAENLRKSVHDTLDEAMAALPEGKSRALLVDAGVDPESTHVQLLYVEKINKDWIVAGQLAYQGDVGVEGKISIAGSW